MPYFTNPVPNVVDVGAAGNSASLFYELDTFMAGWSSRAREACGALSSPIAPEGMDLVFSNPWNSSGLDYSKVDDTLPWTRDRMRTNGEFMTINGERQHYYSNDLSGSIFNPFTVNTQEQLVIRAIRNEYSLKPAINSSDFSPAPQNFISGNINTYGKQDFKFGLFELRCKLPKTCGSWPAFFLLDSDFSQSRPHEIDIMEYPIMCEAHESVNDRHMQLALHMTDDADSHWSVDGFGVNKFAQPSDRLIGPCNDMIQVHNSQVVTQSTGGRSIGPVTLLDKSAWHEQFHTFSILWRSDRLVWSIDGVPVASVCDPGMIPQEPMCAIVNLAVGGTYPGDAPMNFNDQLVIDSFRVWQ